MPDFVVGTAFTANDRVTGAFDRMGKGADKFGSKSKGAFDKASKSAGVFGKVVGGILTAGVIQKSIGAFTQGIRGAVEEFVSFDDAITAAAAKFGGIERGTEAFEKLKKTARDVGATTEFSATQSAEGLRFLAKAGYDVGFAMKALPSFVDLATASENDFARATDIASDVMGAFRLNVEDSDEKLKNLIRVNDVMSKAVNMANLDMEDLYETMKEAGPVAVDAGISLEKFSAIAAFIGGAGIKGSKGGTALKNAIINLTAPTPKAIKELKNLGIEVIDAGKNLKDPIAIFEEFRKKTENMGNAQKSAALKTIFGKQAIAGVSVSIAGGSEALGKFEEALNNAGGASAELANLMRQSIGKRIAGLKSALLETAFRFIDSFEKKIPGAIDRAVESVRNFNVDAILDGIKTFIGYVKSLISVVQSLTPIIAGVTAAFVAYVAIQKIMMAIQVAKDIWLLVGVLKAAASAQTLLNLAMTANPIGLIVVGVGVLVAAIVLLIKHWDKVKAAFWTVVDAIKSGLTKVWDWFVEMLDNPFFIAIGMIFAPFLMIPALIIKNWETVKLFFIGLWALIKNHLQPLVDFITLKMNELTAFIVEIWTPVKLFFTSMWNRISNAYVAAFNIIINKAVAVKDWLVSVFTPIVEFFKGVWTNIKEPAIEVFNILTGKVQAFIDKIKGAFSFIKNLASKVSIFFAETVELGKTEAGAQGAAAAAEGAQNSTLDATLTIAGAPEGSTLEQKTKGAPDLRIDMAGAN